MFKNIGKKIQGYSMLVFVIEVFFSILAGALVGITVQSVLWGDEAKLIGGMAAFLVIGVGIFLAWLGQMRLYAYGKIAESCEAMPLRYNKDKRKNPVFSRVSAFVVAYSIPFPTLIVNEKSVE